MNLSIISIYIYPSKDLLAILREFMRGILYLFLFAWQTGSKAPSSPILGAILTGNIWLIGCRSRNGDTLVSRCPYSHNPALGFRSLYRRTLYQDIYIYISSIRMSYISLYRLYRKMSLYLYISILKCYLVSNIYNISLENA